MLIVIHCDCPSPDGLRAPPAPNFGCGSKERNLCRVMFVPDEAKGRAQDAAHGRLCRIASFFGKASCYSGERIVMLERFPQSPPCVAQKQFFIVSKAIASARAETSEEAYGCCEERLSFSNRNLVGLRGTNPMINLIQSYGNGKHLHKEVRV